MELTNAEYYYKRKFAAENGEAGGPKQCFGRSGKNMVLGVPCGTIIKDAATGAVIADMFSDGQQKTVLTGGEGVFDIEDEPSDKTDEAEKKE